MENFLDLCLFIAISLIVGVIYSVFLIYVADIVEHTENAYRNKSFDNEKGSLDSDRNKKDK